jgi:N-methylhydantoinase B
VTASIDPISREVFQHQLRGIAEQMSVALRRASYSSVIWNSYDYSCGLFTPDGDMLSQAETIPAQLGIMSTAIHNIFEEIPRDAWRPGDVIVCNDPYRGCTHTMDICLFSPVFHDGRMVAITSTIAHHEDIGGRFPGSGGADNEEVFAEGIKLPPLRLIDGGQVNETAFEIIRANVRLPEGTLGDLRAQIAGCRTGERRLSELAARYGFEEFAELAAACLDYAETYARRAIAALHDGESEAEILLEDDVTSLDPFKLHAKATVRGDEIEIDLSASDDQRRFSLNCPQASSLSMALYAVKCVTSPELPQNEGCVRPVTVKTRRGSILDPVSPAAVATRHHPQQAVADVVLKALAPFKPEIAAAGSQVAVGEILFGGNDDRPGKRTEDDRKPYFVVTELVAGGMGGTPQGDGLDAVDTHGSNCAMLSAEVLELRAPVRVRQTALVPDSGGIGEHRGGLAVVRDYEILGERVMLTLHTQQTRDATAPWGLAGGGPGGKAAVLLNPGSAKEERLTSKVVGRIMCKGDVMRQNCAGGGGWGDPCKRNEALIDHDLAEGYVSGR